MDQLIKNKLMNKTYNIRVDIEKKKRARTVA